MTSSLQMWYSTIDHKVLLNDSRSQLPVVMIACVILTLQKALLRTCWTGKVGEILD